MPEGQIVSFDATPMAFLTASCFPPSPLEPHSARQLTAKSWIVTDFDRFTEYARVIKDKVRAAVRRDQRVGHSIGKLRHLQVNVIFNGIRLGHEFIDRRHGLAVERPQGWMARVHLVGRIDRGPDRTADICAVKKGHQDGVRSRADLLKLNRRIGRQEAA